MKRTANARRVLVCTLLALSTACNGGPTAPSITPSRWQWTLRADTCHHPLTYFYSPELGREPADAAEAADAMLWLTNERAAHGQPAVAFSDTCTGGVGAGAPWPAAVTP